MKDCILYKRPLKDFKSFVYQGLLLMHLKAFSEDFQKLPLKNFECSR